MSNLLVKIIVYYIWITTHHTSSGQSMSRQSHHYSGFSCSYQLSNAVAFKDPFKTAHSRVCNDFFDGTFKDMAGLFNVTHSKIDTVNSLQIDALNSSPKQIIFTKCYI